MVALTYKREVDAVAGRALAQNYKEHCFIGRANTRPEPERYVMDYWRNPVHPAPVVPAPDCLAHDPAALRVESMGASGWLVRAGAELIALFDTESDANDGLAVMRHYNRHCYVGRGYSGTDRLTLHR